MPFTRNASIAPPLPHSLPSHFKNKDLCELCNKYLHLDDKFAEGCLKTSQDGQLYLGGLPSTYEDGHYFGGIDYVRLEFPPSLAGLTSTASSGCQFCAAVKKALEKKYGNQDWWRLETDEEICIRMQYKWEVGCGDSPTYVVAVVVSVSHRGTKESLIEFPIHAFDDQEACNRWLKPPQQQVWSAKNTAMVRGWIEDCARGHPEIASGHVDKASPERRKVPFVPRRILDLNPFLPRCRGCVTEPDHEEFGANDIALVDGASIIAESESSGNTFKYAALSYCWGTKAPRIKLDKETLPAKRQGIAFSNLPQCLQDAVIVTRSLGMRYLWIDALCIVQDDAIDWEEQSGEMYQLFNNAFVIIGAAASTAFDQGFLGCRSSSPDTIALDFRSNLDPRIAGKFCLSLIPSGQKHRGFRHDIKVSKWATRGWVWQERMLAKRVLLFGDTMIHLQCDHKHTQSEDGRGVLGQIRSPHKETLNGWTWASWISEYSEKELTRLSDRLPAVSGFAKMMVQNSGNGTKGSSEYLAGIWRDDWHRQLCWVRSEPDQSFDEMLAGLRDREPRTGPTWSWASRRGRVQWVGMFASRVPSKFEAQIEKCEVVRAGKDPMGQVIKDSYLRLSGFLCHAPLVPEAGHRLRRQIERQQDPSNAPHEWQLDWTLSEYEIEYTPDWSLESEGGKEKDRKQEIRLFIVYTEEVFMMGKHRGLLLVDNGKGQFYRVGSFSLGHLGAGPPGEYGYGEWTRESIDIV